MNTMNDIEIQEQQEALEDAKVLAGFQKEMSEMHPQEREMQENADLINFDLYMEELKKKQKKDAENVIAQIRLIQDVCEDALENITNIRKSL